MKFILALAILGLIVVSSAAYGETSGGLGYRIVPNKILENTDGVLQVYSNASSTSSVQKLIATSSDSSIIQIIKTELDKNGFITDVKIRAVGEGTAKIALAAPGFSSQEIPITVYTNGNTPNALLIKSTPTIFTSTGPSRGYVSVELVNTNGFPTRANEDTVVTLSSSDDSIISLESSQLVIKKGDYFSYGQFDVKKDGTAQISATSPSMQTVSSIVSINPETSDSNTVKVYVYPAKISSSMASYTYAIVQLQDSSGNPLQASEDIPVRVQISNSSGTTLKNTSDETILVSANAPLVIKKGSYWGYVPISIHAGINGTWNVDVSARGYQISGPATFSTITAGTLDEKTAKMDLLPVLATGQNELIGIMHMQDNNDNPVLANRDLQFKIDSSNTDSISVNDIQLSRGDGAAPIFAKVGKSSSSNDINLNLVTLPPQSVSVTLLPISSTALQLGEDSLLSKILSHDNFPLALYMLKDGALANSIEEMHPLVTPTEFIQTDPTTFDKGQSIILMNSNLVKEGTNTISIAAGSYIGNLSLEGLSAKPASLLLDHPDKILSNVKNSFSIELLDSQDLPIITDHDIELKLVSNDPSILNVPDSITIKKGSYYSVFDVEAKNSGTAEISVLTSELPLSKFDIEVTSLVPVLSITSTDFINPNTNFDASVTAQYNGAPLNSMKIEWSVVGANIQRMDSVTNSDGKATISLVSVDPSKIDIKATVSGGTYELTSAEKTITVNQPLVPAGQSTPISNPLQNALAGFNPILIILPIVAAVTGIVLTRNIGGLGEKIGFLEKFSEIKEKISSIRNKE